MMREIGFNLSVKCSEEEIESRRISVKVYRLENKCLDKMSHQLEKNPFPPSHSVLEMIMDQYRRAGWENLSLGKSSSSETEFHLEQPSMSFLSYYTLIGISLDPIEKFFKLYQPDFSLPDFLQEFSHYYEVEMNQTFPSHRQEISNRFTPEPVRHPLHINGKKNRRRKRRLSEEEEEEEEEEEKDIVEEIVEKKREDERRKQRREEYQRREYGRILPLSILPVFLSHLPDFYQEVNPTLTLCEEVESAFLNSPDLHKYDTYVKEQVRLLRKNRRLLSLQYQANNFISLDHDSLRYEMTLMENEILQRQLCDEEYREVDQYCQNLITHAIKNKHPGDGTNRRAEGGEEEEDKGGES